MRLCWTRVLMQAIVIWIEDLCPPNILDTLLSTYAGCIMVVWIATSSWLTKSPFVLISRSANLTVVALLPPPKQWAAVRTWFLLIKVPPHITLIPFLPFGTPEFKMSEYLVVWSLAVLKSTWLICGCFNHLLNPNPRRIQYRRRILDSCNDRLK